MKKATAKRSTKRKNVETKRHSRNTAKSNKTRRGTKRGTERVSEYRGEAEFDPYYDRDYDLYDVDLRRDSNEDYEERPLRRAPARRRSDGDDYYEDRRSGSRNHYEWDEGFGDYDDYYDEENDRDYYYEEEDGENWGPERRMSRRGRNREQTDYSKSETFRELYEGRRKRRNEPRGFDSMSAEQVRDIARNNAMRGVRREDFIEDARGSSYNREERAHTSGRPHRRRRHHEDRDSVIRSTNRHDPGVPKMSNLGNSAPGSHIIQRRPKTRKRGYEYVPVVVDEDFVIVKSGSRRRGSTYGKRDTKSKRIRNL